MSNSTQMVEYPLKRSLWSVIFFQISNQQKRAVVLLGLPYFLKEEPSKFYKTCDVCEASTVYYLSFYSFFTWILMYSWVSSGPLPQVY